MSSPSLSDEKFAVINAPHYRDYSLTELEGRACLFSSVYQMCYNIWLLRDDDAWDLRCRIDLATAAPEVRRFMACHVRPLAFIDGGHRIIFRPGIQSANDSKPVHQLCAYNPTTGAIEELLADGCLIAQPSENGHATTKALVYEESLVSTGRPHEDILFSSASTRALCLALQRLPAAILGKLKLVCRTWRAMIESNRFVKLHNHYARTRRSSPLRVFFPDATTEGRRMESLWHASPKLLERRVVSCKPCHGLLLVTSSENNKDVLRVLSPVIDEEITLHFPSGSTTGMGYDEVTEEHVLVTLANAGHGSSAAMECHL
ncbi:hypothetical protein ZWY2020_023856 [Hordeum vulgare]|nr:hypothetical protein ZWY2020_023856 [Hordeum vulgare]